MAKRTQRIIDVLAELSGEHAASIHERCRLQADLGLDEHLLYLLVERLSEIFDIDLTLPLQYESLTVAHLVELVDELCD